MRGGRGGEDKEGGRDKRRREEKERGGFIGY